MKTFRILFDFCRDERAATAIEYGLIASLVAVALIVGAGTLGNNLSNTFSNLAGNMK